MYKTVQCLFIVSILIKLTLETLQEDLTNQTDNKNDSKKTLSRRKRYLVFPEGSSLQLVYCLTIPSLGVGEIFTLGATAALAWELPHNPFTPFRKPAEVLHRIDEGEQTSSGGWTVKKDKLPPPDSYSKTLYNPFTLNKLGDTGYSTINSLLKHSLYSTINDAAGTSNARKSSSYVGRRPSQNFYPDSQINDYYAPVTSYVDPVYHQIYRRTRRDLYAKVENFFTALSKDGKACLRKAVCEVSGASQTKGTFMEEIIKVIFRVKPHYQYPDEDDYDKAAGKNKNCTELYPTCNHSVWGNIFV